MPRFIAHFSWSILLAALASAVHGQPAPPRAIAPGVWFLLGDASKGYSNTAVIEMNDYLIVVDANYPARGARTDG